MLIIDWPIIAQPGSPPTRALAMFATPWPRHSRSLSEGVSVMSSISLAVSSDSIRPTTAIESEYGATIASVCRVRGTPGSPKPGSADGSAPMSFTVGTWTCSRTAAAVSTTIATSGAGTALVSRGTR